ncbi:MAG: aspartate kinase, partial [Muribaculaceae bacterium]|nr:aspartate kinase [Muribaculaceae bacterium]
MKVLKFGGTSVGSAQRIKDVAHLISNRGKNIVVLSAMAGTTNSLLEISDYLHKRNIPAAKEVINNLELKYDQVIDELYSSDETKLLASNDIHECFNYIRSFCQDNFTLFEEKEVVSRGEIMSTTLMLYYLREHQIDVIVLPALDFMRTDKNSEPDMPYIKQKLEDLLSRNTKASLYLTQGYICRNSYGEIDNLRRGGSDLTASVIGAALGADEIEIWTDIDGMHNNDPRYVEGTKPVSELHFEEAAELAYFGAKILHPTCVLPAKLNNIPVRLLNT